MHKNTPDAVYDSISSLKNPVLPIELVVLKRELAEYGVAQTELGVLLGQAMDQSSETFHDNAPADAINYEANILDNRARKLMVSLRSVVMFEYPSAIEERATIGSLVRYRFLDDVNENYLLLSGLSRTIRCDPTYQLPAHAEPETVTIHSPVGKAVLGSSAGTTKEYVIGTRRVLVNILHVSQLGSAEISDK